MKDALTILVVGAVTLVWVTVFVASIFTREYTPLIYVSGPMLAIVGYVTGVSIIRRGNGAREQ
jgi:predicted transcriptional regulator